MKLVLILVIGHRLSVIRPPIRAFGGRPRGNDRLTPQRLQNVTDGLAVRDLVHHRNPQPRPRRRQPLPTGSNPTASWRSPPLSTNETPVRSSGQTACSLVDSPPRERPRAWASCPPFCWPPRRRVDEPAPSSNR